MGKQGPCYHCGVTSTPLWRNGPPDKPVLCNACGSRWRTKGTLTNYTPLHARADLMDPRDFRGSKEKAVPIKAKELKPLKRKYLYANAEVQGEAPISDQSFRKALEEDASNRSSSGSAISYTESSARFAGTDGGDCTAQSTVWDSLVPSRKRTCVSRPKPSSVEKLTKDLYSILHEQRQQSSYNLSGSSEEDLLFESGTPMDSFEMGHGGVLIKHLTSEARDEESEASSLPVEKKIQSASEVYSGSRAIHVGSKEMSFPSMEKLKKPMVHVAQEGTKRNKISPDKLHTLKNSASPLRSMDLSNVANFEMFMRNMSHEEQQDLMKLLPSEDLALCPESLKRMFESPQFLEALLSFQHLLSEGTFDLSMSGVSAEDCRNLKRLALVNLTKSKWVECYQQIKDAKQNKDKRETGSAAGFAGCGNIAVAKRLSNDQNHIHPEPKAAFKSPKSGQKGAILPSMQSLLPSTSNQSLKANYETKEMDNEGSSFSPRSLFSCPPDRSSSMLDSLQFTDESSEQDLLFFVPSNACFPQAELLSGNIWEASSADNRVVNQDESLSSHLSSTLSSQMSSKNNFASPHHILP